ncbi:MAG TPA: zf-HC2 domain-containing protein, partial [Blastocatellia bacterium]|nr:zf-HC2 domain-containing protein [Blastocatellia bacterium]
MFKKHVFKKLSAYCNGELGAEESQRLRKHLLDCERCRKEHDEVKLGVSLAQHLPLVSAPAEMWDEIEALLEAGPRRPVFEPSVRPFSFAFKGYRVAAATAAVALIATLGLIWYFTYNPSPGWKVARIAGTVTIDG